MECTGLLGLPRHVLTFIAQCLLPPDAARLRETCSTFQALIPPRPPVTTCDGLLGHIHYCGHLLLIRINTITPANYEHINAVGMWKEGTVGTCSKKCSKDFRYQTCSALKRRTIGPLKRYLALPRSGVALAEAW